MLIKLCSLSIIIPIIIGIIYWGNLNKLQKYFFWFIGFSVIIEGLSFYTKIKDIDNHGLFKFFLICDLLFFTWFFNKSSPFKNWLKILTGLLITYIIIWEITIRYFKPIAQVESLFYILIFLFFVVQSRQVILGLFNNFEIDLFKNYLFWIASARLIYYLFILFIYVYPILLSDSFNIKLFAVAFTIINTTANIICNVMYGMSFYERK